jgi:predicted Zn-dependent protease
MRAGAADDLDNAISVLREQLAADTASPWLKTRLAEALSRTRRGSREARSLLEQLAKADLIVDAEGYATLARLRKQAGDGEGATAALARCTSMTKKAEVCSDEPLPPPKTARPQIPYKDSTDGTEIL